jgi:hypothetical protein
MCVGFELQKGQQQVVPVVGKVGKISAAQFLGYTSRNCFVELFVEGYVAQVAPPTFHRRSQMLQHMGDAAGAAGQVSVVSIGLGASP